MSLRASSLYIPIYIVNSNNVKAIHKNFIICILLMCAPFTQILSAPLTTNKIHRSKNSMPFDGMKGHANLFS